MVVILDGVDDLDGGLPYHDGRLLHHRAPVHPLPGTEIVVGVVVLLLVDLLPEPLGHLRVDRVDPAEVVGVVLSGVTLTGSVVTLLQTPPSRSCRTSSEDETLDRGPGGRSENSSGGYHVPSLQISILRPQTLTMTDSIASLYLNKTLG